MDAFVQQLRNVLETPVITLDDPVKVSQIAILIATLAVSFLFAGFLRRWLRSLFIRVKMPQPLANRLLALLFLIVIIVGSTVAFAIAGISTGNLGRLFHYPLMNLFQPSAAEGESIGEHNLTLARLFYAFVIVFGVFILSK